MTGCWKLPWQSQNWQIQCKMWFSGHLLSKINLSSKIFHFNCSLNTTVCRTGTKLKPVSLGPSLEIPPKLKLHDMVERYSWKQWWKLLPLHTACLVLDEYWASSWQVCTFEDVVDPLDLLGKGLFRRSKDGNWHHGFGASSPLKYKLQTRVPETLQKKFERTFLSLAIQILIALVSLWSL